MNRLLPNTIANTIAEKIIVHDNQFAEQKDEIRYGLEWIISVFNQVLLVTIIAIPLDILPEALVFAFASATLRAFSGGAHFKSYFTCLAFSTLIMILSSLLVVRFFDYWVSIKLFVIPLLILSLLIVLWKAPVLTKKKHFFSPQQLRKQKITSTIIFMALCAISFILFNDTTLMYCIWFALIIQSLTLTNTTRLLYSLIK